MLRGLLEIVIMFLLITQNVQCSTLDDAERLYLDQFANYKKFAFPLKNQSEAVSVNISMKLLGFQDFDEVTGVLKFIGYFNVRWKEEQFGWEPDQYGGRRTLLVPQNDVWRPTLSLAKPVNEIREIGEKFYKIRVYHDGTMVWKPVGLLMTSCSADITYYPNDKQKCTIVVGSGINSTELQFHSIYDDVDYSLAEKNGEWKIVTTNAYCMNYEDTSIALFQLNFERRPLYFITNFIIPIVLLGVINSFVFVMPADCGERVSYSVTAFLSFAVFLTMVENNMPKNSMQMSLLSYYLTLMLIYSCLIIVTTILNHRLYYGGAQVVPKWIVKWMTRIKCFSCDRGVSVNAIMNVPDENQPPDKKEFDDNKNSVKLSTTDHRLVTWRDVAIAIDKVLFIAFVFLHIICTLSFVCGVNFRPVSD